MKIVRYILLMTLGVLAVQGLAVGFGSGTSNRRLTAPNMCDRNRNRNQGAQSSQEVGQRTTRTSVKSTSNSDAWGDLNDEDDAKLKGKVKKPVRVLSPEAKSIKGDIKVELGEGHGETREEALKEALKDVLQKVVGVYVDSEFRMNNDEIIKDQIITHSNGLIEEYKVLDEADDENGRGKVVTIRARVRIRDFVARVKKIAPAQTVAVDGVLMASDIGNQLNAEALLRKELEDLDLTSLMEVKIEKSIKSEILSSKDGVVVMRYAYTVRYSPKKYYKEFLPRLDRVLTQIANAKPKTTIVEAKITKQDMMPIGMGDYVMNQIWPGKFVQNYRVWIRDAYYSSPDLRTKVAFAVSDVSKSGVIRVREWPLSDHLLGVFRELHDKAYDEHPEIKCSLNIFDAADNVVATATTPVPIIMRRIGDPAGSLKNGFSPLLHILGGVGRDESIDHCSDRILATKAIGFIDIPINAEDVSRIKALRIKLESNSKGR